MCPWKLNVNGHELNSNLKLTERENLINFQDATVPFQLTINNSINDKTGSSKSGRQIDIMKLEDFIGECSSHNAKESRSYTNGFISVDT